MRRHPGAAPLSGARAPVGDERGHAARSTLHARAAASAHERRVYRVLGARAADGRRPLARGVGRLAHPPQQRDQSFPGWRRVAVRPVGEVAGLRAGAEPGRGCVAAPQARGDEKSVLQGLGSSLGRI